MLRTKKNKNSKQNKKKIFFSKFVKIQKSTNKVQFYFKKDNSKQINVQQQQKKRTPCSFFFLLNHNPVAIFCIDKKGQ